MTGICAWPHCRNKVINVFCPGHFMLIPKEVYAPVWNAYVDCSPVPDPPEPKTNKAFDKALAGVHRWIDAQEMLE